MEPGNNSTNMATVEVEEFKVDVVLKTLTKPWIKEVPPNLLFSVRNTVTKSVFAKIMFVLQNKVKIFEYVITFHVPFILKTRKFERRQRGQF